MDGDIIAFDDDRQEGTILAQDGREYTFTLADWYGQGLPAHATSVRFQADLGIARQVINRPLAQRRAQVRSEDAASSPRRRYAGMAIIAIVTALISLLLEGRLVPLNIAAAIFALLGLRQIRRDPLRYQGRIFCWAAIALALVLATLAALVEPTITTPT